MSEFVPIPPPETLTNVTGGTSGPVVRARIRPAHRPFRYGRQDRVNCHRDRRSIAANCPNTLADAGPFMSHDVPMVEAYP
jgi:hypothetical protein